MDPSYQYTTETTDRGLTDMLGNKLMQSYLGGNSAGNGASNLGGLMGNTNGTNNPLLALLLQLMPSITQYIPGLSALSNNPAGMMQSFQQTPQNMQNLPPQLQTQLIQLLQQFQQNPSAFSGQQGGGMNSNMGGMNSNNMNNLMSNLMNNLSGVNSNMGGMGGMNSNMGGMGGMNNMGAVGMPGKPSPNAIAPHGWPFAGQNIPAPGMQAGGGSGLVPPPGYPVNSGAPTPPSFAPPNVGANAVAPYGWPYSNQPQQQSFSYYSQSGPFM